MEKFHVFLWKQFVSLFFAHAVDHIFVNLR